MPEASVISVGLSKKVINTESRQAKVKDHFSSGLCLKIPTRVRHKESLSYEQDTFVCSLVGYRHLNASLMFCDTMTTSI